jgi:hypothetical protein
LAKEEFVQNRRQSAELAKTRDFLLPMLMNGEVEIAGQARNDEMPLETFTQKTNKHTKWRQ